MSHHRMTQPTKVMLSDVCGEGHEESSSGHPTDRSNAYGRLPLAARGGTFVRSDSLHPHGPLQVLLMSYLRSSTPWSEHRR